MSPKHYERASGRDLVRQCASVLCIVDANALLIRCKDPVTGAVWLFLPGGRIEKGESARDAAQRELIEETGFAAVRLQGPVVNTEAMSLWAGVRRLRRDRVYFCDEAVWHNAVTDRPYNLGAVWLPVGECAAKSDVSPSTKECIQAVVVRLNLFIRS